MRPTDDDRSDGKICMTVDFKPEVGVLQYIDSFVGGLVVSPKID